MRSAGLLMIVFGCVVFTRDLIDFFEKNIFRSTPLGTIWYLIDSESLTGAQALIERGVAVWLWQDVVGEFLSWPAWAVLPGLGILLLLIARVQEAERNRRAVF
jgi:hypothetical protein